MGAPALVAGGEEGHADGGEKSGEQAALQARAALEDGGVVGGAFDAAVGAVVAAVAVAVVLAVRLVVLAGVADEVGESEAVVGGDEIDAAEGGALAPAVHVLAAAETLGETGGGAGAVRPETPHAVAVFAIELAPGFGEGADLVAVHAHDVPGLGDELHLGKDGILGGGGEELAVGVECVTPVAGDGDGEIEAEAVHMHFGDPVTEAVEDEAEGRGAGGVHGIAAAGDIDVAGAVLVKAVPVVEAVVQAAEHERGAALVALGGVVVDDIEDDLKTGFVKSADHLFELAHAAFGVARGGVLVVRGEEADGVVAPVVGEAFFEQELVVQMLVDGQELEAGDAEVLQVADDLRAGQPGVGAAQTGGHARMGAGEAFDVQFVEHGVRPGDERALVAPPVEVAGDDGGFQGGGAVVHGARPGSRTVGVEHSGASVRNTGNGERVRIQQELVRIVAQRFVRHPRAVGAVSVKGAGARAFDKDAPQVALAAGHGVPPGLSVRGEG